MKFSNSDTFYGVGSLRLAGATQNIKNLKFQVGAKVAPGPMENENGSNVFGRKERTHFELFDNYITDDNTGDDQEALELDALNNTSAKGQELASQGYRVEFTTRGVRLKYFDPDKKLNNGKGAIKYIWKSWLDILGTEPQNGSTTTPN